MVRTDHSLPVRIIRFMQCHHTPSPTAEHSAFLLPACIVLWTDVITGIPLAVVAKLRARHLFPTSNLSKNKWNSFCYDLHVWFAFHSYFNKQNCSNLYQCKENLTQQRQYGQRQRWSWFQVFAQENGFKVPLPQKSVIWKYFTSQKLMRLIPFEIASVQFTEQIIMNNFYLFIRKIFEHPSLQHLGIPVHMYQAVRQVSGSQLSQAPADAAGGKGQG